MNFVQIDNIIFLYYIIPSIDAVDLINYGLDKNNFGFTIFK